MHIVSFKVLHTSGQMDIVRQKLNEITRKNIERGVTESIIKNVGRAAPENYFFLEQYRGPLLEHRTGTLRIEHAGHRLLGFSHRYRE